MRSSPTRAIRFTRTVCTAGTAARPIAARSIDRPFYVLPFTGVGGALPLAGSAVNWPVVEDAVTVQALFPQDAQVFLRLCNMGATPLSVPLAMPVEAINLALTERTPAPSPVLLAPWRVQTYQIK
ncbi:MAG: hypothetical protein NT031_00995 [Planctomycetota bacterium]|nr:hypothetical protein [Planctomycetota bacterium]